MLPVYTTGSWDYGTYANHAFRYFRVEGKVGGTFRIRYTPIEQDINGVKEFEGAEYIYDRTFNLNENIGLPKPTHKLDILLDSSTSYEITNIKVGGWYRLFSTGSVCETYTDADIAAAGGSGALDGVAASNSLNNYVAEVDKASKWKISNPILDGLSSLLTGLLTDLGLTSLLDFVHVYVPTIPQTKLIIPHVNFPDTLTVSSKISVVTQEVDLGSFSGFTSYSGNYLSTISPRGLVIKHWFYIGACSLAWVFFVSFLFGVVFFIPHILVSFITDWVSNLLPSFNDTSNQSGNIWTMFFQFSWWFYISSLLASVFAVITIFSAEITSIKNMVLAVITFVAINLGGAS